MFVVVVFFLWHVPIFFDSILQASKSEATVLLFSYFFPFLFHGLILLFCRASKPDLLTKELLVFVREEEWCVYLRLDRRLRSGEERGTLVRNL